MSVTDVCHVGSQHRLKVCFTQIGSNFKGSHNMIKINIFIFLIQQLFPKSYFTQYLCTCFCVSLSIKQIFILKPRITPWKSNPFTYQNWQKIFWQSNNCHGCFNSSAAVIIDFIDLVTVKLSDITLRKLGYNVLNYCPSKEMQVWKKKHSESWVSDNQKR